MATSNQVSESIPDGKGDEQGINTNEGSVDEGDESSGLTERTGLIWEWLPTLVAFTSIMTFIGLVVLSATPLPVDLSAVPQAWYFPYILIVGGSVVTTIGADAIKQWQEITG